MSAAALLAERALPAVQQWCRALLDGEDVTDTCS